MDYKEFQTILNKEEETYFKKIGVKSNENILEDLDSFFEQEVSKLKMKSDKSISKSKQNLISKMENINSYDNQLLIGIFQ